MLLDWLAGKAALRYPVPSAPRTAVLLPLVRPGAQVRVFAEGWGDKAEAFQPAAVAGAGRSSRSYWARDIPSLTHAVVVLARRTEELLNEGQRAAL